MPSRQNQLSYQITFEMSQQGVKNGLIKRREMDQSKETRNGPIKEPTKQASENTKGEMNAN